eukprot:GFUD01017614.1.p1 GENE.GFUD01017614.1~~GFUD01017614.1.p1  ORF type:complete len:546 (+),score=136.11 GFUD01017614.1:36-1640(+)
MTNATDVPKGKISCLLCRGFISYKNSDRTRFKDHMLNEHDVKFDSDVILAVSVMTQKEKSYIVKSSLQRLSEISNNQIPSSVEALLPVPTPATTTTPNPARTTNPPPKPGNPRGRPPQSQQPHPSAGAGPQLGRPRGAAPAVQLPTPSPVAPIHQVPHNFPLNQSISISVVDQSAKCQACNISLPNSSLLADHMKSEHLSRFSGLVIATPSEMSNKRASLPAPGNPSNTVQIRPNPPIQQAPSKRPRTIETPVNVQRLSMLNASSKTPSVVPNYSSPQINRMPRKGPRPQTNVSNTRLQTNISNTSTNLHYGQSKPNFKQERPPTSFGSPSRQSPTVQSVTNLVEKVSTTPPPQPPKTDPVIKCNSCSKYVKQSVFKSHKLSHLREGKKEKVFGDLKKKELETPKQKEKELETPKQKEKVLKPQRREEKQIDFVDLGDSDEEIETPIPAQKLKTTEKTIPCPLCDKKLATNMALKMHMNFKHPVKSESVDVEELLAEETDEALKEESHDEIRNEVENMETLELLDNLVNFLNET